MKNMKVATKLIVGFLVISFLLIVVGVMGVIGMSTLGKNDTDLYQFNTLSIRHIGNIQTNLADQRIALRDAIFDAYDGKSAEESIARETLVTLDAEMMQLFTEYEASMENPASETAFNNGKNIYLTQYVTERETLIKQAEEGNVDEARAMLAVMVPPVAQMNQDFEQCANQNEADALAKVTSNTSLAGTLTWVQVILMVVSVLLSVVLGYYLAQIISRPLNSLKGLMEQIGGTGNLDLPEEEKQIFRNAGAQKDEIGQATGAFTKMMDRFTELIGLVGRLADKDMAFEVTLLSEEDTFGRAVKNVVDNMNGIFGEINSASDQVASGAKQVADGSQALAQGSTEQAAAVEQLSSSISEIAGKTKANAEQADRAADLGNNIKNSAEKGSTQMDQMMQAVREINEASQNISKVIGVIDNIAFQTNILALNAAVEAARAGQHGKGFAVVAEEVRSLASKSADAAKNTASMIANSIEKAELGSRIAQDTASSLAEIVEGINESSQIVGEIAKSSEEQAVAIDQINKGIEQVAQVVQQNSATAEESAAASEEMSGQSSVMRELVGQFTLRNRRPTLSAGSAYSAGASPARARKLEMPEKTVYAPSRDSGGYETDYGKY